MKNLLLLFLATILVSFCSCKEDSNKANLEPSQVLEKGIDIKTVDLISTENDTVNQDLLFEDTLTEENLNQGVVETEQSGKDLAIEESSSQDKFSNNGLKESKQSIGSTKILLDSIVFDSIVLKYDTITEGDKLKRKFFFTNKNDVAIEVVSTHPDCGCTAPSFPFLPLEKGQRGFIGIDYNSVGKSGPQVSNIHIKFKGIKEEKIIKLIGFVKDKVKE